ncbi:MAG TPA: hypothetical protein VGC18_15250, partial [Lacisediminihabitans sp.]
MNRTILWGALYGTLAVGGMMVLGATAANEAGSGGDDGIVSGSQVVGDIAAPIQVGGNAISILGDSSST